MAWLVQKKTGIFHLGFRFAGEEVTRSLKTRSERVAQATLHRVEETIDLVERGRLEIPDEANVATFLLSDGKIENGQATASKKKVMKVGDLFEKYKASLPENAVTPDFLRISAIHMRHVARILGKGRELRKLTAEDLQLFITKRSREKGHRGKSVSTGTIRKELATFGTIFRWAKRFEYVDSDFPNKDLKFPIEHAKPPFQTWQQIERQIARGGLGKNEQAEHWDSVFLTVNELEELTGFVKISATYDFLYPMCVLAAHTGARRSELCRSQQNDFDFESGLIRIREKKRVRSRVTYRQVPMSATVREVLSNWFELKAKSPFTFPAEYKMSCDRNGNRWEFGESVSPGEATDRLKLTLARSKWERLKGWHVFRHSFISNLCSEGVDQRFIDTWVGHLTEEMRVRYRHLLPDRQQEALAQVFA